MTTPGFFERSELTQALWVFRREFLVVGAFSMVANVLMLSPTLYMLQIFDRVMSSRSELTLLAMSLITLFLFCVMAFAEWMRSRVLVRSGVRLDALLGTRVFNASFEANLAPSGVSPARAFGDLIQIRQFLTGNGILAFFDTPWTPVYMAVLFILHPMLGFLSLFFAAVQGALAWFGHRTTVAPAEEASKAGSEATSYLQGKLRNAEVLEPMGMVHNLRPHWAKRHAHAQQLQGRAQALTHRITAWSKFIRYSQQSLALGAGALLVIDGQLSPGGMIAANVLMSRALAPIDMLVGTWRGFIGARSAFRRLEALLAAHPERDPALSRVAPQGALALRDVVAVAPGRAEPILKGVSVAVSAGTVTVVLGPSGSGKSTLARCMLGIWPDVSGEVLLDGLPIAGWDRNELGPYVGYLPQDVELFEGSIAENIARFGEVSPEKVIAAARSAGLHEMILRFPKGYDTPIGEAGHLLSGGQRQRIGLARAMYGDPVLVVLDEPNANLDDVGEAALVGAVQELKVKGCTVFLITHRPGIVAVADRVLILRNGVVKADGPRDEVLAALRTAQSGPEGSGALRPQAA
ncbi:MULTISPECIES: type I secretion system permease/ATPase [unclassified Acidovorax]|jgi:ATP-binding cassette subfamily C exporter for protease/lipase|uniref:type I secretion system permease/ATPase n=4 Tax=Acidovorax TaxID=12916 RepID=UPI000BD16A34|nr:MULTISPECIES: type I secretion system permease/ATPase [unclassified Acidovorax]HQS20087.1 type I secretion system permease/ATPase [Acidovorax defluvii]OYY27660.1 MAG: type I secretion system permease/ATPase [Acidovorax sp. 35-64-16]OYZ69351.1 MAG: type I secretion system permease/ATPase [Acidovorax sp. 24-64-9]OZA67420.1 MAG: type I secretion system permease/ATPase [Acidovorax sp. 39-64-12]HQS62984.1 type I secretion system permease/ATPase [Acidovorax defluvii]